MIFGLALSVGAITLVSSPPTDVSLVFSDLLTFGFSFLILITIWLRYTRIMSVLPLESPRVIKLNIILLFLVSVEPFLFNLVRRPPAVTPIYANVTSTLYGADLGAMFTILGFFTFTLASEEKNLVPKDMVGELRREGIIWFINGSFFLVSLLPIFFTLSFDGEPIRYYFWFGPFVFSWLRRRYSKFRNVKPGDGDAEAPARNGSTSSSEPGPSPAGVLACPPPA